MQVRIKSFREMKLQELTQDQFNKWDSARQQQWLADHPTSKFKPQDTSSQPKEEPKKQEPTKAEPKNSSSRDEKMKSMKVQDYYKNNTKDYNYGSDVDTSMSKLYSSLKSLKNPAELSQMVKASNRDMIIPVNGNQIIRVNDDGTCTYIDDVKNANRGSSEAHHKFDSVEDLLKNNPKLKNAIDSGIKLKEEQLGNLTSMLPKLKSSKESDYSKAIKLMIATSNAGKIKSGDSIYSINKDGKIVKSGSHQQPQEFDSFDDIPNLSSSRLLKGMNQSNEFYGTFPTGSDYAGDENNHTEIIPTKDDFNYCVNKYLKSFNV